MSGRHLVVRIGGKHLAETKGKSGNKSEMGNQENHGIFMENHGKHMENHGNTHGNYNFSTSKLELLKFQTFKKQHLIQC